MRLFIAAALLLAPALAAADDNTPATRTPDAVKMHADDCARARKAGKTCVLDMGGEDIGGKVVTPPGQTLGAVSFGTRESLIRVRREFITEILRSAENID